MKRRYKIVLVFFFVNTVSVVFGQLGWKHNLEVGTSFFEKGAYQQAIYYLEKANDGKVDQEVLKLLGESYFLLRDFENAELYFKKSLSIKQDDRIYVLYCKSLLNQGKYAFLLTKLEKENVLDEELKRIKQSCDSTIYWLKNIKKVKSFPLNKLNSVENEVAPTLVKDALVFSSDRQGILIKREDTKTGAAYYDLYRAKKESGRDFQKPYLLNGFINTANNEGASCFNESGDEIYFTRSEFTQKANVNHSDHNQLKLYQSKKENGVWTEPKWFLLNDSSSSFGHPFLTQDGKAFFFVSDLPGGFGGTDIYISLKISDSLWSEPINLGEEINTDQDEMYPAFYDGFLYFSSNGHVGMGGFDLYKAESYAGAWRNVVHLPPGINSSYDDISLIIDLSASRFIFTSNRVGGIGKLDLYWSRIPK